MELINFSKKNPNLSYSCPSGQLGDNIMHIHEQKKKLKKKN
jgi:hypothetical protein